MLKTAGTRHFVSAGTQHYITYPQLRVDHAARLLAARAYQCTEGNKELPWPAARVDYQAHRASSTIEANPSTVPVPMASWRR